VQNGDPLYTAVPSLSDADALLTLRDRILEYLAVREEHSARASLVTFFKPPERSLSEREYHRTLWHILQTLHLHDPEPWPADIPTDPDDPYWEFCLGGEPMFPDLSGSVLRATKESLLSRRPRDHVPAAGAVRDPRRNR